MPRVRCPISYEIIGENQKFSPKGLKYLSPKLITLKNLAFNAVELRQEAKKRSTKMSIQGVQPKLSAQLHIKDNCFQIVNAYGKYIIKPPNLDYAELPENEDLSMHLAQLVQIEVPIHGLIYNNDDSFSYFIKRFDRVGHNKKIPIEDFAQLSGQSRDTKYNYSMEKLISIIDKYCTFPALEKHKLFMRVIFNFLIGNEDMHLKNYSLISRNDKIELTPAYDFVNSTIAIGITKEEIALPLNGKKNHLTKKDLVEYYGHNRLKLNQKTLNHILETIGANVPEMHKMIDISFLSTSMKEAYHQLLFDRSKIIYS